MIIPAKKLTLVILRDWERLVLRRLGELGVVHLRRLGDEDARRFREAEAEKLRELEGLADRLIGLWRELSRLGAAGGEDAYRRYAEVKDEVDELRRRRAELQKLERTLAGLRAMGEEEIPAIGRLNELFSLLVIAPSRELEKLRELASRKNLIVRSAEISGDERLVHILGLSDELDEARLLLSSVYHQEISLPSDLPRRVEEALSRVRMELERVEGELRSLEEELERLRDRIIGFSREDSSRTRALEKLGEQALELCRGVSAEPTEGVEEFDLEEASRLLEELSRDYRSIRRRIGEARRRREELERIIGVVGRLLEAGVEEVEAGEYENLCVISGRIEEGRIEDFERGVSGKPVASRIVRLGGGEAFLTIACLKEDARWILNRLKVLGFEDLTQLFSRLGGDLHALSKRISMELEAAKAEEEAALAELEDFEKRNAARIAAIARTIRINLGIEEALMNTLRSEDLRIIQGWVSAEKIPLLREELEKLGRRFRGGLAYRLEEPSREEEAPTILRNPKLFKIFESIVAQYGWPGYREVDPTIISGILWTLMFGFMFPDFGQGLVIAGLGAFLAYRYRGRLLGMSSRKVGRLMIRLGVSAAIFGLLFGEFFLMEVRPLIPNLRPGWLEDPAGAVWLLKTAIFFGAAQIILGMAISTWNELRHGDRAEALLAHHGLAGIAAFLGFILTAFNFLGVSVIPGVLEFPELGMAALSSWPFYLMVAGFAAMALKPLLTKDSIPVSMGNILEVAIAFLANTFSYARIAGFAIVHAALAMVVHRMIRANLLMGIGVGLIFLNLFALSIELLVCAIQALRLLYYEFYSKFYRGSGTPYRPWRLR